MSPTTGALLLLLIVFATATLGRLWIATSVAIVATLTFNFFFLPPLHTLAIEDAENWIALAVFLIVAVVGSQLSAAAQSRAREAERGALAATLLTTLSHDLRTPLTAIRVAVENLRGNSGADERREQSDMAVAELDRLNRLFEDILDMARIDADAVNIERQWVSPADVVDAAAAQAQPMLSGHRLVVDADSATNVEIDPRVASMALSQLLENAAKYSPRQSDITVRATADADGLHVTVTDQGQGLDATELEHLFERFYRGAAARQLSAGTGLGLAITRGLLAAVDGRVWGENLTSGGARFTMVIPAPTRPSPVST